MRRNSKVFFFVTFLFLCVLILPLHLNADNSPPKVNAPLFDNLSSFHFPISTKVPLAQRYFDQGFVLYYGFEWGEAIRSFRAAIDLDPHCGMCYFGLALALGDKMNAPMNGHEYSDAKNAIQQALFLKQYETNMEQDFIKALALRYQHPTKKNLRTFSCHPFNAESDKSSQQELITYAHAMKKVMAAYPNDNNAKALYAYALFDVINWKFWDENGKINPRTPEIINTVKAILAKDSANIGGNHYYIHVMEQSREPQTALESAKQLETLVPGSEHLVHMPTHIYFLTGRFHEASQATSHAIDVSKQYMSACKQQGFEPEINYLYFHNYDYLRTTAAMEGNKEIAMKASHDMLNPPFDNWLQNEASLQWFIPIHYFVEARFGVWQDLLKESEPSSQYQYALGMWHYARGMAFAHLEKLKDAENESRQLTQIIDKGPNESDLQRGGINLLMIAHAILNATIADLHDDETATFAYLKAAKKIQHDMGYHEPPDWYFPVNEALADAYLKWGHPQEAIMTYQEDLQQYPKNGWALFGLANSLKANGETLKANQVMQEFNEAWQHADIAAPLTFFKKHR